MRTTRLLAITCTMCGLLFGCGSALCDAESLRTALRDAQSGDTVRMGSCTIDGSFLVPAGVVLAGAGPEASILRGSEPGTAVVRLVPGDPPARLEGIGVESSAAVAVYATGAGTVELSGIEMAAREGVGALFVDVTRVTLDNVTLTGPIPTPDGDDHTDQVFNSASSAAPESVMMLSDFECGPIPPRTCTSGERREASCPGCGTVSQYCDGCGRWVSVMATQGLTFVGVTEAVLSDVDVRGFAQIGVVAEGTGASRLAWVRGTIAGNMRTGLYVDGVDVTLEEVAIVDTYSSFGGSPAAAGFITDVAGATTLTTRALRVSDSRGFGLVHLGGTNGLVVEHDGLEATSNGLAAIWVGQTESFELSNSTVVDNRLAGVVVVSARGVTIRDTVVSGTRTRTVSIGSDAVFGSVTLGDGILLFDSLTGIRLQGVTLDNNERVGLTLDLGLDGTADADLCGAARDGVCFDSVTVRSTAGQRGAIAGNMTTEVMSSVFTVQPVGSGRWDDGIAREGSAVDDATFVDPLELTGAIAPLDYPIAGAIAPLD